VCSSMIITSAVRSPRNHIALLQPSALSADADVDQVPSPRGKVVDAEEALSFATPSSVTDTSLLLVELIIEIATNSF